MVSTRNWIAIEYCSGLICASLIHLRPLIERLLPGLLGVTREDLNKSKPATQKPTGPREFALNSRASMKRRLDPYVQMNTTAIRANTVGDSETSEGGIRITRDFSVTSEPNPLLAMPAKVLHRCKTVVFSRAEIVSPATSPV
jgi:hypothetical protein